MDSSWYPWIGSVAGSMLVGLSGIVPLLVFPDTSKLKDSTSPSSDIPLGNVFVSNYILLIQRPRPLLCRLLPSYCLNHATGQSFETASCRESKLLFHV